MKKQNRKKQIRKMLCAIKRNKRARTIKKKKTNDFVGFI